MKRLSVKLALCLSLFAVVLTPLSFAALRGEDPNSSAEGPMRSESARPIDSDTATTNDSEEAPQEMISSESIEAPKAVKKTEKKQRIDRADAFVAGADWEFDGFVSGGQDQEVRTMFYQGDLVYLNIGTQQGVNPGDRLAVYKRGNKIKDPQTGKFIGYEVRRAAYGRASDRVDDETCSIRIVTTFEPVEIGDLVRRE